MRIWNTVELAGKWIHGSIIWYIIWNILYVIQLLYIYIYIYMVYSMYKYIYIVSKQINDMIAYVQCTARHSSTGFSTILSTCVRASSWMGKLILVGGFNLSLWNIWVRQLGLLFPTEREKMLQSTNQYTSWDYYSH